jgi:hypothetical protein
MYQYKEIQESIDRQNIEISRRRKIEDQKRELYCKWLENDELRKENDKLRKEKL